MNRRRLLVWLSRSLQACIAGAIAIPGLRYVLAGVHPTRSVASTHQRVARLQDLRPGHPLLVAIVGRKQDGWLLAESQVIGRAWLVRGEGPDAQVQAFTSVCPHMGCQIQLHPKDTNFLCPCHRAAFGFEGERLTASQTGERNHAPRGMDALDCRIVKDEASGESWVEVRYEKFKPGLTQKIALS